MINLLQDEDEDDDEDEQPVAMKVVTPKVVDEDDDDDDEVRQREAQLVFGSNLNSCNALLLRMRMMTKKRSLPPKRRCLLK